MLLTNKPSLDSQMEFEGAFFNINLRFENVLRILEVLEDEQLSEIDQTYICLHLLTGEYNDYYEEAKYLDVNTLMYSARLLKAIFERFLFIENENAVMTDLAGNPLPVEVAESERSFSYTHDADYIYSSFLQAYGIRLYEEVDKMSWHEFQVLFEGLPDNTKIMEVIKIRTMDIPKGKGTEEQAQAIRKAKKQYALPSMEKGE